MTRKLKTIDLFSGIGGFSYALSGVARTVAYCEIDEGCQRCLKSNMRKKKLHKAPVHEDVTRLDPLDLKKLRPQLITAGFPCQDISVANPNGQGLKGKRSGLFREILRLVDGLPSIQLIFLENSSRILKVGFNSIRKEMNKRGFEVRYTLIRASDVGALHKRLRWYCLCYRPQANALLKEAVHPKAMGFKWLSAMEADKVVKIKSPEHKASVLERCKMLGNSIVPQCAIWAWNVLVRSVLRGDTEVHAREVHVPCPVYKKQPKLRLTFNDGKKKIVKSQWATPCYSVWHNYTYLTERGARLVSNQTFYYNGKIHKSEYNKHVANPVFVERLMGYPTNWTKC